MKELLDLFLAFARVGGMTFGGGYAMLPILQREIVEGKGWATEEELAATNTPGDFYYHMAKRFPTASLNIYSNEMNAEVFKGGRDWAWNEDPDERWLAFRTAWRD